MARIVVPGGQITSTQARMISKVSELYAQGKVAVTTRQSIQLHWVKTPNLAELMRELAGEGLTTFHGCGDVNRNVAACPLAETLPLPAGQLPARRQRDLPADGKQPRPGQPAAQIQDYLLRMWRRLRPALYQLCGSGWPHPPRVRRKGRVGLSGGPRGGAGLEGPMSVRTCFPGCRVTGLPGCAGLGGCCSATMVTAATDPKHASNSWCTSRESTGVGNGSSTTSTGRASRRTTSKPRPWKTWAFPIPTVR